MDITVSVQDQSLTVQDSDIEIRRYLISTSRFGLGETEGSHQTPRGRHIITEKIGDGTAPNSIFKGRIPTGEIWTPDLVTEEDLILTRILWLSGDESHNANSHQRYIYIHGTNQEDQIGTPASMGCIRMRNHDILDLFDLVEVGTSVTIK